MDWELRLVTLYEFIGKQYREQWWVYCQRFSPYADVAFTDEEVICIYLWGLRDKRRELKESYEDTRRHLHAWYPHLPSYGGSGQRLNRVAGVFVPLLEARQAAFPDAGVLKEIRLMAAMPLRLAHAKRSGCAGSTGLGHPGLWCVQGPILLWGQGACARVTSPRNATFA